MSAASTVRIAAHVGKAFANKTVEYVDSKRNIWRIDVDRDGRVYAPQHVGVKPRLTPAQRATARRLELVKQLAPPNENGASECAKCHNHFNPSDLEIDHVDGVAYEARSLNSRRRIAQYEREFAQGVRLRALCRSCNAIDGCRRQWRRRYG